GKIRAFLTPGGHYRIKEDEFERFMDKYVHSPNPEKILIVEDDPVQRKLLMDTLSAMEENYILGSSEDGYDALIKVGEFQPDLLITDIIMPKLDGVAVIKKIRSNAVTKAMKIIVVTSYPEELGKVRTLIQGFFIKPIEMDLLKSKIKELLGG
ncbi:MAG: hypothetical protein A2073_05245, partial [Deltaproteobacteria bacterium GWC2_42_11]